MTGELHRYTATVTAIGADDRTFYFTKTVDAENEKAAARRALRALGHVDYATINIRKVK